MKKKMMWLAALVVSLWGVSVSVAGLEVKLVAPKTDLLPSEQITVTLYAYANHALATGTNGLNAWQFDVLVSQTGVVQVVPGSVVLLAPTPFVTNLSGFTSINTPKTGQITYLHVVTNYGQPSTAGVGGFTAIAQFDIQAIGSAGQSVDFSLGGNAYGILADDTELNFVFDSQNSQRTFTIVPEPATMALFVVGCAFLRKR